MNHKTPSKKFNAVASLALLALALFFSYFIFLTQPKAEREGAVKKAPMLVDVITVELADQIPSLSAFARVVPKHKVQLRSQVSGRITKVSDSFIPGATVAANAMLVEVDAREYLITLKQRESVWLEAQARFKIEQGEQALARDEYKRRGQQLPETKRALVLREPQLQIAEARVAEAKAAYDQAQLNVERARVSVPFNALILSRGVVRGSEIRAGNLLGEVVDTKSYWLKAKIPADKLPWLGGVNSNKNNGAGNNRESSAHSKPVKVFDPTSSRKEADWLGTFVSLVTHIDETSNTATAIVSVEDPLQLSHNKNKKPLILGSFVRLEIPTVRIPNSVKLERSLLRADDTVWVYQEGRLDIRAVTVAFTSQEYVYIDKGLAQGEQIVTSNLSRVKQGASLRLRSNTTTTTASQASVAL